jgi:hypothetical protein
MTTFRQSINNLIDSTKPQSPTDVVFLYGSLTLIALWVYVTLSRTTIPHLESVMVFLVGCKGVKVVSDNTSKKGVVATAKVDCDAIKADQNSGN